MDKEKICGTCEYHRQDSYFDDDYVCCNTDSINCADWTDYNDSCVNWEERKI